MKFVTTFLCFIIFLTSISCQTSDHPALITTPKLKPGQENPVPALTEKEKHLRMNREAKISLLLYGAFFIWWYATGYGLAGGDPADYVFIFGLPVWFFLSCVVGWLLFSLAAFFVVKVFFTDFDLGADADE